MEPTTTPPPSSQNQSKLDENKVNLLDLGALAVASSVSASRPIRALSLSSPEDDTNDGTADNSNITHKGRMNARMKLDGSVVTDADFAAQGIIVRALRKLPGNFRIVGEESPEEMELHMRAESGEESEGRETMFRLAKKELYNRYHCVGMDKPPLSQASQRDLALEPKTPSTKNDPTPVQTKDEDDGRKGESSHHPGGEDQEVVTTSEGQIRNSPNEQAQGEDRPEYIVDASRVSVFVDPLDGTKSYAKGEYDSVTILIAIILDNHPYFGVITKPFGYKGHATILDTGCVTIYGGTLLGGVFVAGGEACRKPELHSRSPSDEPRRADSLPRAVISQSRSEGIVTDFVDYLAAVGVVHPEPIHVSGAGEKSLRLVLGQEDETLWFFPKAGTSRWDVAASDALLRAFGGRVTDKFGQELDYSTSREDAENEDGIIASNNPNLHAECIRLFIEGKWHER